MLPNCIVIGAPRSGTTSVYEHLNAHPEIFMSRIKEPDFFLRKSFEPLTRSTTFDSTPEEERARLSPEMKAEFDWYEAQFADGASCKVRGEASAGYLESGMAMNAVRRFIPDARMIVILRDPSERIHSHYVHASRIRADFGDAAANEAGERAYKEVIDRAARGEFAELPATEEEVWLSSGFYHRQLTRAYAMFPREQFRVFLFEDLVSDAQKMMTDIYGFLGVDDSFTLPTTEAFNAGTVPKNQALFRMFTTRNPILRAAKAMAPTWLRGAATRTRNQMLGKGKPPLDTSIRSTLVRIYRDDILKLQDMLGRDLSAWLNEAPAG